MAEAAAQPAAPAPAAARGDPRDARGATVPRATGRPGARRRARHRHLRQHGRDRRRAEPARGGQGRRRSTPCATCRPAAWSASSPRTGAPGSWSTRRPTSAASGRRSTGSRSRAAAGDLGDALELAGKLAARAGGAQILVATDGALAVPPTGAGRRPDHRPARSAATAGTRRSSRSRSGRRRRRQPVGLRQRRQPGPGAGRSSSRGLGRRPADRGPRRRARSAGALGRRHRRRAARRRDARAAAGGADASSTAAPDLLARRRPRLGDHPARPDAPDPARRTGRSVPRDRAQLPAQRRAVRRQARRVRPGDRAHGRAAVGPRHLRGLAAGDAAPVGHPGHRAGRVQPARRGDRDAQGSGHRLARPGRAGPALRRPVDDPHRARRTSSSSPTGRARSSRVRAARRCCTPGLGPGCRRRSSPSSHAAPTSRSRSPSRSSWRT